MFNKCLVPRSFLMKKKRNKGESELSRTSKFLTNHFYSDSKRHWFGAVNQHWLVSLRGYWHNSTWYKTTLNRNPSMCGCASENTDFPTWHYVLLLTMVTTVCLNANEANISWGCRQHTRHLRVHRITARPSKPQRQTDSLAVVHQVGSSIG